MARLKNFSELTAAGKRARVARDVLQRLDAREIRAGAGYGYISVENPVTGNDDLQGALENKASCQACALGCMFMADVMSRDRMSVAKAMGEEESADLISARHTVHFDPSVIRERLRPFFGKRQLALIESAYEGRDMSNANEVWPKWDDPFRDEIDRAVEFNNRRDGVDFHPEKRLRRIMENIVAHRGNFVP